MAYTITERYLPSYIEVHNVSVKLFLKYSFSPQNLKKAHSNIFLGPLYRIEIATVTSCNIYDTSYCILFASFTQIFHPQNRDM